MNKRIVFLVIVVLLVVSVESRAGGGGRSGGGRSGGSRSSSSYGRRSHSTSQPIDCDWNCFMTIITYILCGIPVLIAIGSVIYYGCLRDWNANFKDNSHLDN
mmetsp:Transcript_17655/g.2895  ORF Transcript_17655/g.2895 Transcript_17655/m.2895 type:complete len:102 (+) Transcript_17655:63-368(+)